MVQLGSVTVRRTVRSHRGCWRTTYEYKISQTNLRTTASSAYRAATKGTIMSTNTTRSDHWSGARRPNINITPVERAGRILMGAAAVIAAVILLTSAGSAVAVVLELLLAAAGLDLVITGAIGHCPLYKKLGYVPPSLRGSR